MNKVLKLDFTNEITAFMYSCGLLQKILEKLMIALENSMCKKLNSKTEEGYSVMLQFLKS